MIALTDARPMSAPKLTKESPMTRAPEEVNHMLPFDPRKGRSRRPGDELSEIDRAVLLESVRLRRKVQDQQRQIYTESYGMRTLR